MPGKSDEPGFARFLCYEDSFLRAVGFEDSIGIIETNHFVMLQQVEMIGL